MSFTASLACHKVPSVPGKIFPAAVASSMETAGLHGLEELSEVSGRDLLRRIWGLLQIRHMLYN